MFRRVAFSGALIIVVLALSSLFLFDPRPNTKAQSTSACCGPNPPTAQREIVFPYYSLADGFNSTLLLVSDSGDPLNFIIAIHSLSGQTQLANSMTIQPGAKLPIDMRSLLGSLGADATGTFSQGSVSVYFEGTIMPLVGQMTIENPSRHWVQQAEMVENDPGRTDIPAVLSGQWWGLAGGRDATIMVTNASGNIVTADVLLAFGGKEHKVNPLVLNPNATKLLSVADMLSSLNTDVSEAPEGRITIIQQGPNPSLVAQGRVTDPVTGFSTTLEFPDPARQHASALHASGIPVGTPTADSPYAGDGTFTPHVIASNLSSKPQTLIISVEFPKSPTWNSANGPGGPAAPQVRFVGVIKKGEKDPNESLDNPPNPDPSALMGHYVLAPLTIGPDSTADFSLASVMSQLPLPLPYASVRIQYSGAPGSVIAQVSSVDERQDLVVDARTANEVDGWAGSGANPWHVDSQTDSILFLTDEGDKPARIGFGITAGGTHYYLTSLQLAPGETRAINIRELRDNQVADFQGNKIAASATDGSVNWIRLDSVPVEGRLMVIQKQQGMASNYDCSTCYCPAHYSALSVAPGSFGLVPAIYQDMGSTATYSGCNGGPYYYNVTSSSTWSSNNTPVIHMDSTVHYRADAAAGGTATVLGSYTDCTQYDTNPDFDCPCINYQPKSASGAGTVVWVTLSLKTSGTLASDDFAASTMTNLLGTNNLHTLMDTNGYWVTPVEVVGNVTPSTYTGNIIIRRQLLGDYVYDNCTLIRSDGPGDDASQYPLYDWDPQSGGSAGKVYDTDEPGIKPGSGDTVNDVYHFRANFYEYAQTSINGVNTTVSGNLYWFSRVSYLKTSSGSQLSTSISGDNIAGTGATKTSCNLQ